MKAFVIKNKEGKMLCWHYVCGYYFDHFNYRSLSNMEIGTKKEIKTVLNNKEFDNTECSIVPITIAEGDLEQETKQLEEQHDSLIDVFQEEREKLCKQIKQESDARKRFVEKVKQLKEQLSEKDKEIERLKYLLLDKENKSTFFEQLYNQTIEDAKIVKDCGSFTALNKIIRKQVCDEIRDRFDNIEFNCNTDFESVTEILDQIEQGGQQ